MQNPPPEWQVRPVEGSLCTRAARLVAGGDRPSRSHSRPFERVSQIMRGTLCIEGSIDMGVAPKASPASLGISSKAEACPGLHRLGWQTDREAGT